MDLDAFVQVHETEWAELKALCARKTLTGEEADRLVLLYQRTNTHLSTIRSTTAEPALVSRLSLLLLQARTKLTGGKEPFLGEARRFLLVSFPASLWRLRWWVFWIAAVFLVFAVGIGVWVGGSREVQSSMLTDEQIRQLVDHDFTDYYSEHPAAAFAAHVWTNNAWVAARCVALGIFGVFVPMLLFSTASNVGMIGGLMVSHGRGEVFFGYLLPHGLLELTAVFVAAGAGMKLFWTMIAPGPLSRGDALAREGRALFTVALGLVVVLFVSGLIEAFITPSHLPTWARLGIGVLALLAFLGYAAGLGYPAAVHGETGDLRADQRGDSAAVAG